MLSDDGVQDERWWSSWAAVRVLVRASPGPVSGVKERERTDEVAEEQLTRATAMGRVTSTALMPAGDSG